MSPGFYPTLAMLLVFVVACLAGWQFRRRYITNWHRRAKLGKISTIYVAVVLAVMCVLNFTNHQPFWPREAISCGSGLVVLGCMVYSWRTARHKAAAEPPPPPEVRPPSRPNFFGQTALILLPLLVLAGLASWALVSDRLSVQTEAKARAGEIAASVLGVAEDSFRIVKFESGGFSVTQGRDQFSVNERFELVSPRPRLWPPQPAPLTDTDFSNLNSNKLTQWREAEVAFEHGDWSQAADLYLNFLERRRQLGREPMADFHAGIASSRFRPIALFRRAVALERLGDIGAAIDAYNDIFNGFTFGPQRQSEAGLPLEVLATLKILELAGNKVSAMPDDWRKNPAFLVSSLTQNEVSPLTDTAIQRLQELAPALVNASAPGNRSVAELFDIWEQFSRARQCYAEAMAQQGTNAWAEQFWVKSAEPWLAVRQKPPDGWPDQGVRGKRPQEFFYAVLPGDWLFRRLFDRSYDLDWARNFAITVEIAGEVFTIADLSTKSGTSAPELTQRLQSQTQPISLTIQLNNPRDYFKAVERRQWLLGALIGTVLVAGAVAAWMSRRSLLKQLRLNDMKSNFVSSVSHELRAPIASVRLLAESLERGKISEPAKQNEYFRFIGQECRRLSALIENVLDFSRIEQGRKQYEFEPTDLSALVEQTVKLMQPYAEERGVTLKSEVRSQKSEIEMDGRAMQQALVNLIDNAIKHSPKDAIVTVALETRSAECGVRSGDAGTCNLQPSTFNLSVSDSGPGIPASEHEKIFERFYRLGSELRRETQGVGIGLSIVKHVVEAHRGCVRVESEVGKGSRFTIELPGKS